MSECYEHEKLRRQGSVCPYCRIAELEAAIEFAFNNAANSFMGVNFSFEAVKKLREALAKLQEKDDD